MFFLIDDIQFMLLIMKHDWVICFLQKISLFSYSPFACVCFLMKLKRKKGIKKYKKFRL